jgi:drug/metabolite transporter (DMT)-like permease
MRKAQFELHLAVLLFGVAGLFGKLVSASPVTIVFGRSFFAAVALYIGLRVYRVRLAIDSRKSLLLIALCGLILVVHWVAFFHAIQVSTVAIGLVGFATFPVFVTFLEPLVAGQKYRMVDFASAALVVVGLLLVAPGFSLANQGLVGLLWAVLSGALFAVLVLINRRLVADHSAFVVVFYQLGIASLCLAPLVVAAGAVPDTTDIGLLLVLGIVCTALPHALFIRSLAVVKAQLASVVTALEPVYGIAFAVVLLHEIPNLATLAGATLVFAAVWLAMAAHSDNK